jgi:hypothetical protein
MHLLHPGDVDSESRTSSRRRSSSSRSARDLRYKTQAHTSEVATSVHKKLGLNITTLPTWNPRTVCLPFLRDLAWAGGAAVVMFITDDASSWCVLFISIRRRFSFVTTTATAAGRASDLFSQNI